MEHQPPKKSLSSLIPTFDIFANFKQALSLVMGDGYALKGVLLVRGYHMTAWKGKKDLGYGLAVEGDSADDNPAQLPLTMEPRTCRDRFWSIGAIGFKNGQYSCFNLLQYLQSGTTNASVLGQQLPELPGEGPQSQVSMRVKNDEVRFKMWTQSFAGRILGGGLAGAILGGTTALATTLIPQARIAMLMAITGSSVVQKLFQARAMVTAAGAIGGGGLGATTGYNIFYPPTTNMKIRASFDDDGFIRDVRMDRGLCTPAPRTRVEMFYINPRDLTKVQYLIVEGGNGNPESAFEWLSLLSKGPTQQMSIKASGFMSMADFKATARPMLESDKIRSSISEDKSSIE